MKKEFYDRLAEPFEKDEKKRNRLVKLNQWLTRAVYIIYPVILAASLFTPGKSFWRVLLVPAVTFFAVTVFRRICNAKRPYEVWDVKPLIPRDKKGHSFPSRHTFSIYIIAMAAFYVCLPLGILLAAAGVFLASARIVARVHFVKDVVAGAALGVGLGVLGFFILS